MPLKGLQGSRGDILLAGNQAQVRASPTELPPYLLRPMYAVSRGRRASRILSCRVTPRRINLKARSDEVATRLTTCYDPVAAPDRSDDGPAPTCHCEP